jgi:hypothetical protein
MYSEFGKQEVVAYFKTLSRYIPEKLTKSMETLMLAGALSRFEPAIIQKQVQTYCLATCSMVSDEM